jgi:sugar lactone lactonase YvrE
MKNLLNKSPKKLTLSDRTSTDSLVKFLEFKMPSSDLCHVSCLSVDKVWVGDEKGRIMLMDKTGNKIEEIKTDTYDLFGYHAVTEDGDLLYINKSYNSIKKYTSDRKTTTVITTSGSWSPLCVYSSHRTGDILVGMTDGKKYKVVRYNQEGRELWQSQYDAQGQRLYKYPKYITENLNGDICTSDGGDNDAVVVVDRDGNHRFSYRGRQGGSKFHPWGICTNIHGWILVIEYRTESIHVIEQNGEFISVLLTRDHGLFIEEGLCTDSDNNVWLCGEDGVKMYKYLN